MSDLRQAAQQVLEAWQTSKYGQPSHQKAAVLAMTNLHIALEQQQSEPVHGDIRALKYRIHELEGEVIGYKRMLDVAEAAPQRKPMTCQWSLEDDDFMPDTYRSACGELWSFIDGGLKENRVNFCHGCGGKVVEASSGTQEPKS